MKLFNYNDQKLRTYRSLQGRISELRNGGVLNLGNLVGSAPVNISDKHGITIRGNINCGAIIRDWVPVTNSDPYWARLPVATRANLWKARVSAGELSQLFNYTGVQHTGLQKTPFTGNIPSQLVYNGRVQTVCRTPGWEISGSSTGASNTIAYTNTTYNFDGLSDVSGMYIVGSTSVNYAIELKVITGIDTGANRLTSASNFTSTSVDDARYFGANLPEFMLEEGYYWIDLLSGVSNYGYVYFYAPLGEDPNDGDTYLTALNSLPNNYLFTFTDCSEIVFEDFSISNLAGSAMRFSNCQDVSFVNTQFNAITNTNVYATDCTRTTIQNTSATDIGGQAFIITGGNRVGLVDSETVVDNLTVENAGFINQTSGYVFNFFGVGLTVTNSTFKDSPGVCFIYGTECSFSDTVFDNLTMNGTDGGFLYMGRNPALRGFTVDNCQFLNINNTIWPNLVDRTGGRFRAGIYADDGACEFVITNSLFEGDDVGFRINGGNSHVVTNSDFNGLRAPIQVDDALETWLRTRTAIPDKSNVASQVTLTGNVTVGATSVTVGALPNVPGYEPLRAGDKLWFENFTKYLIITNKTGGSATYAAGDTSINFQSSEYNINLGQVGKREGAYLFYTSLLEVDYTNAPYATAYPNLANYLAGATNAYSVAGVTSTNNRIDGIVADENDLIVPE